MYNKSFLFSDFVFASDGASVCYIGDVSKYHPDRKNGNLTKYEIAWLLDRISPTYTCFVVFMDAYTKSELVSTLFDKLSALR